MTTMAGDDRLAVIENLSFNRSLLFASRKAK